MNLEKCLVMRSALTMLNWQKRSMRAAKDAISQHGVCVKRALDNQRMRFVGHVGRFGTLDKVSHICKAVFLWRPLQWWEYQKWYNEVGWDTLTHDRMLGGIRSFERHLAADWIHNVDV